MPTPLPTLDQIMTDPGCLDGLSEKALTQLLLQHNVVLSALTARLVVAAAAENGTANRLASDEMLSVPEVAKLLKRTPRWIWRNKVKLPFLRKVGNGRGLLASRRELEKWLAGQRVR